MPLPLQSHAPDADTRNDHPEDKTGYWLSEEVWDGDRFLSACCGRLDYW